MDRHMKTPKPGYCIWLNKAENPSEGKYKKEVFQLNEPFPNKEKALSSQCMQDSLQLS